MLRLAILITSSLLTIPLIAWLAAASDERALGRGTQPTTTTAAGVAIAVLFALGGLLVLARPLLATMLFLLAAVLAGLVGYDDGLEGLASYGLLGLLLATMSAACSRRRVLRWHVDGADNEAEVNARGDRLT